MDNKKKFIKIGIIPESHIFIVKKYLQERVCLRENFEFYTLNRDQLAESFWNSTTFIKKKYDQDKIKLFLDCKLLYDKNLYLNFDSFKELDIIFKKDQNLKNIILLASLDLNLMFFSIKNMSFYHKNSNVIIEYIILKSTEKIYTEIASNFLESIFIEEILYNNKNMYVSLQNNSLYTSESLHNYIVNELKQKKLVISKNILFKLEVIVLDKNLDFKNYYCLASKKIKKN
jgi:hypothetical protein